MLVFISNTRDTSECLENSHHTVDDLAMESLYTIAVKGI